MRLIQTEERLTVQKRKMIAFFDGELPSFQVGHHALCPALGVDKGILYRCHGGDSENLLAAPEFVRVEQLYRG